MPEPAAAAPPARGASYFGFNGTLRDFDSAIPAYLGGGGSQGRDATAALRVSRSGRRLSGRRAGSYIRLGFGCKPDKDGYRYATIRLASRRVRGARIRRDGSFRAVKRTGRVRYRLRGRFVSRQAAKLVYRASAPPQRPKNSTHPGRCRSPRIRVALGKDGQGPFRSCRHQPARTVIESPTGRLFAEYRLIRYSPAALYEEADSFDGFYPYVFGCLFQTNRRFALGPDFDAGAPDFDLDQPWPEWPPEYVENPRLAGRYAAWASVSAYSLGIGAGSREVRAIFVRDLRTGLRLRAIGRAQLYSDSHQEDNAEVGDLALKDNGSVAWIADASGAGGTRRVEVWAADTGGRRRLDSGPGIARDSLNLRGSTLSWIKDGVVRSAGLY